MYPKKICRPDFLYAGGVMKNFYCVEQTSAVERSMYGL
jgi:hypothetical protein